MSLNAAETAAEAVHSGSMLIGAGLILGGAAAAARVVITSASAAACARRDGGGGGDRGDSDADDAEAPSSSPNAAKSARAAKFALLRRRAGSASGLAMMGLGGRSSGGGGGGGEDATANNSNNGPPPPSAPSPPHLPRSASAAVAGGARFVGSGGAAGGADSIGADEAEEACRGYLPWDDLTADDGEDDGEAGAAASSYYLSRCVAVDCTHPRLPTLTHHRANRNPPGLSPLSDTSTGLVLSALSQLSSWRCPRPVKEVLARPYATCNHFDVDGLLALWCFLPQNRANALRLEPTLRHAARIGDFREAYLCPDLVSALGSEDKLTFIREAYSALKVATWVWATERRLFSAPYAKKDAAEKYRWFLPRLGRVLADPEAYWSEWQRDYSAAVSGFDLLAGPDALVERWWPSDGGGGGGEELQQQSQQQQQQAPAAGGGALGGLLGGVNLVIGGIGNLLQLGAAGGGTSSSSGGGGGGGSSDGNDDDGGESGEGGGGGGIAQPPAQEALGGGYGYGPLPTSSSRPDGAPPLTTTTTPGGQPFDPRNPCPLAVVRAPEPCRYSALFSHTCGCDAVLALYDGRRYELELKYTTFVQMASRAAWPRVDLRPLAAALNDVEMRSAAGAARAARAAAQAQQAAAGGVGGVGGVGGFDNNDDSAAAAAALGACNGLEPVVLADGAVVPPVRWVADALTDPGPLLRLERVEALVGGGDGGDGSAGGAGEGEEPGGASRSSVRVLKLPKPQRYGDPCDRPIYSSTIPPAKFQAVVASYLESALRETGARPRGPVTRVVATPPGNDAAALGFGGGASADNTAGAGWSWEAVNALNDDLRRRVAPAWRAALLERDAAGALDGLVAHGGHEQGVVGGGAAAAGAAAAFGGAAAGWGAATAIAARDSAGAAADAAALTTASGWHYDTERSGRRRHTHHHRGGGATPPFHAANPVFGMAAGGAGAAAASPGGAATTAQHQQQMLLHEQQHAIPLVAPPAPATAHGGGALDPPPHLSEPSPILAAAAAAAAAATGSNDPSAPLRALAAALPALQRRKPWTLLYSTARDGTSLATLLRKAGAAAGGRAAPSVLLVRDRHGAVFGAYCTEPWRATTGRFFGTGESWVFRLCPGAPMRYPWVGPEPGGVGSGGGAAAAAAAAAASDAAADSDDRHRRAAAPPRTDFFQYATPDGLGVGGGGHFAIFLDEELLHGSSAHCLTYASPCLASSEEFGVRDVECWWVGGAGGVGGGDYRMGAVQAAMAGAGVVGGGIAPLGRSGGV